MQVGVDFYNMLNTEWEPLIEPWIVVLRHSAIDTGSVSRRLAQPPAGGAGSTTSEDDGSR